MDSNLHVVELCGTGIVVAAGIACNVFNLAVTVAHQLKVGIFQTVGLIIFCISLSNVLLEISMFGMVVMLWLTTPCWTGELLLLKVAIATWIQSSSMSFWSIAWLSVFYCVKVVRVSGTLLVKLKRNISSLINAALMLTPLCSFLMSAPLLLLQAPPFNGTAAQENKNSTCLIRRPVFPSWVEEDVYVLCLLCFLCPVPLMVMLPTSLRLVVHLCQHTQAMRRNETGFQSADSYLLVCKLTVSLVAVYKTTLAIFSFFFIDQMFTRYLQYNFISLSCSFYCIVTGILLTVSNRYLKEKLQVLFCWRNPPKAVPSTQSGDTGLV
ncbi:taste receptor type 2 member 40-like [Megalops cyprinoides]|uniref:taste receptor type 2 member 40-like n=1 Tax=Megalops cyprinoides TaxID=118141 RepID=UPI001863F0FE|nr:taste receptor type 2 member 40-like [Megalops cyprinoides]